MSQAGITATRNEFDEGRVEMAVRLGPGVSETAGLVGRSEFAVVSVY